MKITNETKSRVIIIEVVETEDEYYPSYRVKVEVKTEYFEAKFNRDSWISAVDLDDFIVRLKKLDETRNGFEKLLSMSPEEFQLGFKNIDNLGHLAVSLQLKKESQADNSYKDCLQIEFEIDPTSLRYIISDLEQLKH